MSKHFSDASLIFIGIETSTYTETQGPSTTFGWRLTSLGMTAGVREDHSMHGSFPLIAAARGLALVARSSARLQFQLWRRQAIIARDLFPQFHPILRLPHFFQPLD